MTPRAAATSSSAARTPSDQSGSLHLVLGPEELLADRMVERIVTATRQHSPGADVIQVAADSYQRGDLAVHTSPSLFGEASVVVINGVDTASDDFIVDAKKVIGTPFEDVTLVLRHQSGQRGKAVLDAARKAGARIHECKKVTSDGEKTTFVMAEFRAAGRKVAPNAAASLVEALGQDLRELANACRQLAADTSTEKSQGPSDGPEITVELVQKYYGGRVEATGFAVCDAVLAGQTEQALGLVRHAMSAGIDPVPLVAVLAMGLRALAKASGGGSAGDLGMAPWQLDKARKQLRGWSPAGLSAAIGAVVAADHAVKGGVEQIGRRAADPKYAVERAILEIGSARRGITAGTAR